MRDEQARLAALHLAAIVESSDDAIVSKSVDGTIRSWNRGAERIFGFSAAEAVGRSIRIIIPADRQAEEDEVLRRILRGESVDHFETIRQRKDGSQFPIAVTISPIRDIDGTIIGASKIARDISERKAAEAALANAEARQADLHSRLLALVRASASLLGTPRIEEVLPAILKLAGEVVQADGYAVWRLEAMPNAWKIASHAGVSEEFANAMVATFDGRPASPVAVTEPIAAEDVETVPMLEERIEAYRREGIQSLLAIPLASDGLATATLVFYYRDRHSFSDVEVESARALGNIASSALRTADLYSEQRYREYQALFLARAGEALASSLDYQGTLKTLAFLAVPQVADWCAVHMVTNEGIERLAIAHPDHDRISIADRFYEKYPPKLDDKGGLAEVLRSGRSLRIDQLTDEMIVAGARDAEHLQSVRDLNVASLMMVPLRTRRGTVGAITFVREKLGRRYTEADLRFAETVADRAAVSIENSWAYEEVRTANRLKDEFLATLSHELRTPLNAMLGYTRMLRSAALPEDRHEAALEVIERNGKMLAKIVEEILDVSRIISGKLRLNVQRTDPGRLIADALAIVEPAAEAKGITLHSDADADMAAVIADPDRLRQVLWNLLTNAVKFTPSGGRVDVRLVVDDADVDIIVSDTGRGIERAFLPYIFERFRQADSRFTREHGGLGLGLSIARQIIEMHGGTIEAASEGEGRGATFTVRLPAAASSHRLTRPG